MGRRYFDGYIFDYLFNNKVEKWNPTDIIAIIIVSVVSVILLAPLFMGREMSEEGKKVYSEVIIGYLSVLLIYIGYKLKK